MRFFIFANNKSVIDNETNDFILNHKDYNESICIFMNQGLPLRELSALKDHPHKWFFFRTCGKAESEKEPLVPDKDYYNLGSTQIRDLSLLMDYDHDKFFLIPDPLESPKVAMLYRKMVTEKKLNINLHTLSHFPKPLDNDMLNSYSNNYGFMRGRRLSTGLIVYEQLRHIYDNYDITIIGFTAQLTRKTHNPEVEELIWKEYIAKHTNLEVYRCFDN